MSASTAPALRELKDLPGPRTIPWLGNLHQVKPAQLHQNVEAWRQKYGPYFRIKFGVITMLVTSFHIEWSMLMAASVMMSVPVIVVFAFLQKHLTRGFGAGGVKG